MTGKVSVIIPCLNEEDKIIRCLDAIGAQTYDHSKIEILIADGMSKDRTRELIAAWQTSHDVRAEIVDNPRVIAEFGNAEALKRAWGDYIYLMGADEVMAQTDMIEKYIQAFEVYPEIAGVEQEFLIIQGGPFFNNFLAAIHINDPLARDIATPPKLLEKRLIDGTVYRLYEFRPGYPAKLFFKREYIAEFIGQETFEEGQVMLRLAQEGRNTLAWIDGYGVYHYNVKSLRQYLRKRAKIALKHTTRVSERKTWVSYTGKKLYLFAFLHLTFVYPFLFSIVQTIRMRQPIWLMYAPFAWITTFVYAWNFLIIKLFKKKAW